jgi:hypothetical protein
VRGCCPCLRAAHARCVALHTLEARGHAYLQLIYHILGHELGCLQLKGNAITPEACGRSNAN